MGTIQLFRNIDELITLEKPYKKSGRNIVDSDIVVKKKAAMASYKGQVIWTGSDRALDSKKLLSQMQNQIQKKFSLKSKPVIKSKDISGGTVLPGFVECHTHSVFAGDRTAEFEMRNQGASYQEIAKAGGGILSTMKATRKASKGELTELYEKRVNNFIRQGVTTLEVKSGYALDHKNEIKMLEVASSEKRIRICRTYLGAHALPKDKTKAEYLDQVLNKTLPSLIKKNLVDRCDIFVEEGYFNTRDAHQLYEKCKASNLGMTIHADQLSCTGISGVACKDWAIDSVDHVVEVRESDIDALAKSETTAVLLPTADFYLKMKYPPARKLLEKGARVALATDFNPGSSPTQNLTFVGLLARLEMKMSLSEVLTGYTIGAAHALGLGSEIGALVPGLSCDFMVLDGGWRDLFYDASVTRVKEVYMAGKKVSVRR